MFVCVCVCVCVHVRAWRRQWLHEWLERVCKSMIVPVLCAPDGSSVVGTIVVGTGVGVGVVGASVGVAATHTPSHPGCSAGAVHGNMVVG